VKDPLWARTFIVIGVVLVVASGGLIGAEKVLAKRYNDSVKRDTLLADDARAADSARAPSQITGPLNFLLLGSDARPVDNVDGNRADTIISRRTSGDAGPGVPGVDPARSARGDPAVRAHRVHRQPREDQLGVPVRGRRQRRRPSWMSMTLANLLNIRFDGAALVDFTGFQDVVKALGGVDMCVDHRVVSEHVGFDETGNYLQPARRRHAGRVRGGLPRVQRLAGARLRPPALQPARRRLRPAAPPAAVPAGRAAQGEARTASPPTRSSWTG
jgi:hypothetical protein